MAHIISKCCNFKKLFGAATFKKKTKSSIRALMMQLRLRLSIFGKTAFFSEIVLVIFVMTLFLIWFSHVVPFCMDEFSYYHVLATHYYPLNMLNHFRESSIAYDLKPFLNYSVPLRENMHQGSFSSLLYLPVFLLWPSPYSARLLTLILIAVQSYCLSKIFRTNLLFAFCFILVLMPYTFVNVFDIGPSSFHMTSVFLIYLLTQRWLKNLRMKIKTTWLYPLSIGLLIFICIWIKLSYFAILPGIICLIAYQILTARGVTGHAVKFKPIFWHCVLMLAVVALPTFLLFQSRDVDNQRYFMFLFDQIHSFNFRLRWDLISYFLHPLMNTHKVLIVDENINRSTDFVYVVLLLAILIYGILKPNFKKSRPHFVLFVLNLFCITFFCISISPISWAASHMALCHPFLILALFCTMSSLPKNKIISSLFIVFFVVNAMLYYRMTKLDYRIENHPAVLQINRMLSKNYADKYVFIIIDWGMYYTQSLYGNKKQCVLYLEPLDNIKQIDAIKKILHDTGRKAIFVGRIDSASNLQLIQKNFPNLALANLGFECDKWRVWVDESP